MCLVWAVLSNTHSFVCIYSNFTTWHKRPSSACLMISSPAFPIWTPSHAPYTQTWFLGSIILLLNQSHSLLCLVFPYTPFSRTKHLWNFEDSIQMSLLHWRFPPSRGPSLHNQHLGWTWGLNDYILGYVQFISLLDLLGIKVTLEFIQSQLPTQSPKLKV